MARGLNAGSSRYETLLPIGTGGMATVSIGRSLGSADAPLVALKRAHPHVQKDARLAASMKLEAHLASRLHHPNVVSVLDVEEINGELVLVLDYIEGCTLRSLMTKLERSGESRAREIIRVILDVAAGLHAAHQAADESGRLLGLVHRDVSPSNVLIGVDGVARLSDFGIAKLLFESSERTEIGILKGKSSYMAPEYVVHQRADASSDLFSLAVVGWEALSGARLFKGTSEIETLERVARAKIRPLGGERPELALLDVVFYRALSRQPSDRQRSVEELASELERLARAHDLVASHAEVSALVERLAEAELEERRRLLRSDAETMIGSVASLPKVPAWDDGAIVSVASFPATSMPVPFETAPSRSAVTARLGPAPPPPRQQGRERLALTGAFLFLGAALGAMWTQLSAEEPEQRMNVGPVGPTEPLPPAMPAESVASAPTASVATTAEAPVPSASTSARTHGRRTPVVAPHRSAAPGASQR